MGNIGTIDRIARGIIGILLISLVFIQPQYSLVGWFGVLPLVTAIFAYCPIYKLFGYSSCKFH